MAALDDETGGQIEEAIRPLEVASRAQTNGGDAAGLHAVGWVIFFMDLTIGSKWHTTVAFSVEFVA